MANYNGTSKILEVWLRAFVFLFVGLEDQSKVN